MRARTIWTLATFLLLPASGRGEDDTRPAVAVMEFASKGGVTQEQMDALGELLANDIRALEAFRVIGKSDIQALLQYEEKKALTGCSDDSCIAEIGGALGARYVAVGSVSLFGDTYLLNLKVLDVAKVAVVKGVSQKVQGGESALLDATSTAVQELFVPLKEALAAASRPPEGTTGGEAGAGAEGGGVAVAEAPPEKPRSKQRLAAHITLWTGVGLTVLGGAAAVLGYLEGEAYRDGEPDAVGPAKGYAAAMWGGLGLGLASMTTGLILWFTEPEADEAAVTSGGLSPTPDGQGLVLGLGGRW